MYTPGTWDLREQEEEDGMDVVIMLCLTCADPVKPLPAPVVVHEAPELQKKAENLHD